MKKTLWYPAHITPVRKGWYEVKDCWCACPMHRWNGKQWGKPGFPFSFEPLQWRGVMK